MDTTAAVQYILTAAQSSGSQVYYKTSRMTNLGLLVYYSGKTSRHRQNELSCVPKKILTWMLREARGGLKATVGNRVKPDYHFIRKVFLFFSVSFSKIRVFPGRLYSKACQQIIGHCRPKAKLRFEEHI